MSKAKEYEDDAHRLQAAGKLESSLAKFNLASKAYEKEGDQNKAQELAFSYKLVSGLVHLSTSRNLMEIEHVISEFKQARKLLRDKGNSEDQKFGIILDGMILQTEGLREIWKGESFTNLDHFEKARKKFLLVKDRAPNWTGIAEILRLETTVEVYHARAIAALDQGDMSAFTMNLGECRKTRSDLLNLVKDHSTKELISGTGALYDSSTAFRRALLEESDFAQATSFLKESSDLAAIAIQSLASVGPSEPRAETLGRTAKGLQLGATAMCGYLDGITRLYAGSTQLARQNFQLFITQSEAALEHLAQSGEFGRPLVELLSQYRKYARQNVKGIATAVRHWRKRIALSAGQQFGLVFAVTFTVFVILQNFQLFQVSSFLIFYGSLIVAAITAFGLNAVRLKNLLLPTYQIPQPDQDKFKQ